MSDNFNSVQQVDICIATYRRVFLLSQLLESLKNQNLPGELRIGQILIVDNDPEESARETVALAGRSGLPVSYLTQPQKSISLTRNVAVSKVTAPLLAFIDDDERATPDWLTSLYTTMQNTHADVVSGPVQGVLSEGAPRWVRIGGFFDAAQQPTGSLVLRGATNNALLKTTLIPNKQEAFDPRYGLTGGEDTDFFEKLRANGAKMVWCHEALVYENVPLERSTVKWLLSRDFRGGQCFADIVGRPSHSLPRIRWFIYRLTLALAASSVALLAFPFGRVAFMRVAKKAASNWGQVSSVSRRRYVEYKAPQAKTS